MPLITRSIPDNPAARQMMGGQLPSTLRETLGATFADPLLRGTQLLLREGERQQFERREQGAQQPTLDGRLGGLAFDRPVLPVEEEDRLPVVDPEKLNEEYGDLGISFDRPVSREYAEIRAKQKREEIIRQDIIARGPKGIIPGSARFGTMLAGAAIDPLNVAAAFIPVVREARYAGMVARFGTTRARLVRGMTEGVIGNAAIEPVIYGLAKRQQMDYTLADAAINIGLGGILGGGLHLGAGKISDFVASRSPQVRETALRSSVSQMAQGRRVDVEPVFRLDEGTAATRIAMEGQPTVRDFELSGLREVAPGHTMRTTTDAGVHTAIVTDSEGRTVGRFEAEESPNQGFFVMKRQDVEPEARGQRIASQALAEMAQRAQARGLRLVSDTSVSPEAARAYRALERRGAEVKTNEHTIGENTGNLVSPDVRTPVFEVISTPQDLVSRVSEALTPAQARSRAADVARAEASPEKDATANFEASRKIAREREVDAREEVEFLETEIESLRNERLLTEADEGEIRQLDELGAKAERYQEAARIAARCVAK